MKNAVLFFTLLFAAITLSPLMAHLLELHNKINLAAQQYLLVQKLYNGWALLGIVEIATLCLTLTWAILVHKQKQLFHAAVIAFLFFLAGLSIFFIYTFPVNQKTNNWTQLPTNWRLLREQWEYSHALHATLFLIGFCFLIFAAIKQPKAVHIR